MEQRQQDFKEALGENSESMLKGTYGNIVKNEMKENYDLIYLKEGKAEDIRNKDIQRQKEALEKAKMRRSQ